MEINKIISRAARSEIIVPVIEQAYDYNTARVQYGNRQGLEINYHFLPLKSNLSVKMLERLPSQ